jgi:hypothetical protein
MRRLAQIDSLGLSALSGVSLKPSRRTRLLSSSICFGDVDIGERHPRHAPQHGVGELGLDDADPVPIGFQPCKRAGVNAKRIASEVSRGVVDPVLAESKGATVPGADLRGTRRPCHKVEVIAVYVLDPEGERPGTVSTAHRERAAIEKPDLRGADRRRLQDRCRADALPREPTGLGFVQGSPSALDGGKRAVAKALQLLAAERGAHCCTLQRMSSRTACCFADR